MDNKIRRRKVSKSNISNNTTRNNSRNIKKTQKKQNLRIQKRKEEQKKMKIRKYVSLSLKILSSFVVLFILLTSFLAFNLYNKVFNSDVVINDDMLKEYYISTDVASSEDIPKYLKDAIVSIEDERFYNHKGVDFISLFRSVIHNIFYDTTQGGSTIEMQLSKNLLTNDEKTIKRKITDIRNAIQMDKNMTKDEILVAYLNNIYLGKSSYGVKEGAKIYFGKDLYELSLGECAMLAGITNNPLKYKEFVHAKSRQELILGKMKELGYITDKEYKEAMREDVVFKSEID